MTPLIGLRGEPIARGRRRQPWSDRDGRQPIEDAASGRERGERAPGLLVPGRCQRPAGFGDHMDVPDPLNIANDDDLRAIHEAGDGFVFNTFGNKLHASSCDYVGGMTVNERKWFFSSRADAEATLAARRPGGWTTCPQCLGSGGPGRTPTNPAPVRKLSPAGEAESVSNKMEVRGPDESRTVEAWSDVYVQYPPTSPSQAELRADISRRVGMLAAEDDEVLHAVFSGPKHPQADVENLLTYNIDDTGRCFESAARNGVRFEHASSKAGASPSGLEYAYSFRYALEPTAASFQNWRPTRTLVEFDRLHVPGGRFWSAANGCLARAQEKLHSPVGRRRDSGLLLRRDGPCRASRRIATGRRSPGEGDRRRDRVWLPGARQGADARRDGAARSADHGRKRGGSACAPHRSRASRPWGCEESAARMG